MTQIDIETIYPQAEKDREGEKLKRLCAQHEGQKNVHADGRRLIDKFVKPRRLKKIGAQADDTKISFSHRQSPDQSRFMRSIEQQAWKFAHTQYIGKIQKAEQELKSKLNEDDINSQFMFGSKGEILFSDDDTSRPKYSDVETQPAQGIHDSMKFTSIDKTNSSIMGNTAQNQMMQSTY